MSNQPTNKFKFRITGSRSGLHAHPMAFTDTASQAGECAQRILMELEAFDAYLTGLGPVVVVVEPVTMAAE